MPAEDPNFPGRQRRERKNGSVVWYWVALAKAIALGFLPKTERLDYPEDSDEMSRRCFELQAQMDRWLADPSRQNRYDGKRVKTIRELIRLYGSDPLSPYFALDEVTQQDYDWKMRVLDRTVGTKRFDTLYGRDFREWYNRFKEPRKEGLSERVASAYSIMAMVRALMSFGVQWGVPDTRRLRDILHEMRFQNTRARQERLTYEMAVAFIVKAHDLGFHEMALAQALQFELMLRQWDVIGKWRRRGQREPTWVPGLVWQEINRDRILTHTPGKTLYTTNLNIVVDLKIYPLVDAELDRLLGIPESGPVIIDSETGLPFEYRRYWRRWRHIAGLAGIPKTVWNRDSRAGGVTEGGDAGADIEDLRQHAGHSRVATTQRYNRKTLVKTTRVEKLRVAHRNENDT